MQLAVPLRRRGAARLAHTSITLAEIQNHRMAAINLTGDFYGSVPEGNARVCTTLSVTGWAGECSASMAIGMDTRAPGARLDWLSSAMCGELGDFKTQCGTATLNLYATLYPRRARVSEGTA